VLTCRLLLFLSVAGERGNEASIRRRACLGEANADGEPDM